MGNIPNPIVVDFDISENKVIVPVELEASNTEVGLDVALDIRTVSVEDYDGDYIVIPKAFQEQVLLTKGKAMIDDVTVREIPYYETSNEYGGYTVNIGG